MTYLAAINSDSTLTPLQSAVCAYCIALGPRAGQNVLTLRSVPRFDVQHTQQRCVSEQGFSLHAEVRCAMNQRHKLKKLCRDITRPAIANKRLKLNSAG
ncbi:MAG: transposase [Pseudomonadota bacterium]